MIPKRSKSYRDAPQCIISTAQHARPNVIGQSEPERAQFTSLSAEERTNSALLFNDFCGAATASAIGAREECRSRTGAATTGAASFREAIGRNVDTDRTEPVVDLALRARRTPARPKRKNRRNIAALEALVWVCVDCALQSSSLLRERL